MGGFPKKGCPVFHEEILQPDDEKIEEATKESPIGQKQEIGPGNVAQHPDHYRQEKAHHQHAIYYEEGL